MVKLKRASVFIVGSFLATLLPGVLSAAEDIKLSTPQVIEATINAAPSCLKYKVIGLCFWKVCAAHFCWIEETLKVDQYLPDAVVSIYRKDDSNPWDYPHTIVDPLAHQIGQTQTKSIMGFDMGVGYQSNSQPQEQNNHFKEADLIGNPAIAIFQSLDDVFLPSQAKPFMPYYLSQADSYLWRSPLIEMALYPSGLVPGLHVVGSLINNWGNVYPRTGFIDQPADGKVAAVIAQRAADIATRTTQPHVYQPLNINNSCGDHCDTWEAKENDPNTNWQMIYPKQENICVVFGENDLKQLRPWEQDAAQQGDGNYAWIMWRHYRGCIPDKGGTYVGSIDF
jgi:integrating conjugative element protein (TIGR03756 family)